jgi:hypothetical protein
MELKDKTMLIVGLHARTAQEKQKGVPAGVAESIIETLSEQYSPDAMPMVMATYNTRSPDDEFRARFRNVVMEYTQFNATETSDMDDLEERIQLSARKLNVLVNCVAGTYHSKESQKPDGAQFNPSRERQMNILKRIRDNKNLAEVGQMPDPDVVRVTDFTEEEIEKTRIITGDSHIALFNRLKPMMSNGSKAFSYSFTGHERTPNYGVVSKAKTVLEEFAKSRNGESPQYICISTGLFLSPATSGMPYFREFLGLVRERFPDIPQLTSKDIAEETLRMIKDDSTTSGIHYFRDEAKSITPEEQRNYLARVLGKK